MNSTSSRWYNIYNSGRHSPASPLSTHKSYTLPGWQSGRVSSVLRPPSRIWSWMSPSNLRSSCDKTIGFPVSSPISARTVPSTTHPLLRSIEIWIKISKNSDENFFELRRITHFLFTADAAMRSWGTSRWLNILRTSSSARNKNGCSCTDDVLSSRSCSCCLKTSSSSSRNRLRLANASFIRATFRKADCVYWGFPRKDRTWLQARTKKNVTETKRTFFSRGDNSLSTGSSCLGGENASVSNASDSLRFIVVVSGKRTGNFFVATFSFLLSFVGSVCQLVAELPNKRIVDKRTHPRILSHLISVPSQIC